MRLGAPITSRTNAKVKALRAAFAGRASKAGELTAVEGEHLLAEVALAGLALDTLFVREGDEASLSLPSLRGLRARERVVLRRDVFESAVETMTPQGLAGTLEIPAVARVDVEGDGPVLLLENVQDPGNVGTLIRSAAAFGAAHVWLMGECANAWSPKVLRASAGAVFRVPVTRGLLGEVVGRLRGNRRMFAAVPMRGGAVTSMEARLEQGALMIGSEGRGLTAEALGLADELVTIPCSIESLNAAVAGSLLLYEAFRQGFLAQASMAAGEAR